jgi:hypothetical protein
MLGPRGCRLRRSESPFGDGARLLRKPQVDLPPLPVHLQLPTRGSRPLLPDRLENLHVVVEREVYKEEAIPFEIETVEDSSMMKGDTKDKQTGKNGKSGFTYKVIEQNGKQTSKETIKEVTIEKPVKRIVTKGTKVVLLLRHKVTVRHKVPVKKSFVS